jgi:phospho-N-acetylmuramoyl-pentapeptide-transferase
LINILLGVILAFLISIFISPTIIKIMTRFKFGQPILNYVEEHKSKQGTPTIGGIIFIGGTIIATLLIFTGQAVFSILTLVVMLGYGILGFLDDYIKIKYKHNQGLRAYQKIIGQLGIATLVAFFAYNNTYIGSVVWIPFLNINFDIGIFIIPLIIFIFIACTNSVNLTDGLDGLAGSVMQVYLIAIITLSFILIPSSVNIQYIQEINNLRITAGCLFGGILGFLCFNAHPAKIFMGDTGSLALGAFIACFATFTQTYLAIPFFGVMFVVSALSDIIQVLHFKRTKKRVFLMAPYHHHLQKKGMYETKIVTIYITITMVISMLFILAVMLTA